MLRCTREYERAVIFIIGIIITTIMMMTMIMMMIIIMIRWCKSTSEQSSSDWAASLKGEPRDQVLIEIILYRQKLILD